MNKLEKLLEEIPQLQDQIDLFENTLFNENFLDEEYKKWVAFSAAIACKNKELYNLIEEKLGALDKKQKEAIVLASSRMAVTNPYFMARSIKPLQAGGSLDSIYMRDFSKLGVENHTAYHYACISISIINGGYVCFNSHLHSLKAKGQNDLAIDQALRISSSIHNLRQLYFNSELV